MKKTTPVKFDAEMEKASQRHVYVPNFLTAHERAMFLLGFASALKVVARRIDNTPLIRHASFAGTMIDLATEVSDTMNDIPNGPFKMDT